MTSNSPIRDQLPLIHPIPRRPYQTSPKLDSSTPVIDTTEPDVRSFDESTRTKSILNLTSSTLSGIYSPTAFDPQSVEASTPWGTGSQTPIEQHSVDEIRRRLSSGKTERPRLKRPQSQRRNIRKHLVPLLLRSIVLSALGVVYGVIITHLQDERNIVPVKVGGINRNSWPYLVLWGSAGVGLGHLLPMIDILWAGMLGADEKKPPIKRTRFETTQVGSSSGIEEEEEQNWPFGDTGAEWGRAVRGIGVFVGVSFAIRKLPWESTIQATLTIFAVDPVIWYIIDRSQPGFFISTIFGIVGTAILLGINPALVPPPAQFSSHLSEGNTSYTGSPSGSLITVEQLSVWIWISSVLFCAAVCFGNVGRRLALPGVVGRPYM
ncbi:MAG: hypothetical protein M1834_006259 [Cirrosporium novae-zelandiae]|nr:MAG: hypothetical protein M1834_006259 [Cirrosporium novae-zelandiae]